MHEYSVPNNPDNNEWNNLCLEDIGIFWDLPNWEEAKYYYFNTVQLNGEEQNAGSPVTADSKDEVIEKYYKWSADDMTYKRVFQGFGSIAAASLGVTLFTLL